MRYGVGKVCVAILKTMVAVGLTCAPLEAAEAEDAPRPAGERTLEVRVSWGHTSRANTPFHVRCLATGTTVAEAVPREMEPGETPREGAWKTRAGGGDVDAGTLALRCPDTPVKPLETLNVIWRDLIARSDADTARRRGPRCR